MLGQKYKRTISYALVFLCLSKAINYPVALNDVLLDIAAYLLCLGVDVWKTSFFIIAGDIYVSGIGVQNLLPSGRREPD